MSNKNARPTYVRNEVMDQVEEICNFEGVTIKAFVSDAIATYIHIKKHYYNMQKDIFKQSSGDKRMIEKALNQVDRYIEHYTMPEDVVKEYVDFEVTDL